MFLSTSSVIAARLSNPPKITFFFAFFIHVINYPAIFACVGMCGWSERAILFVDNKTGSEVCSQTSFQGRSRHIISALRCGLW